MLSPLVELSVSFPFSSFGIFLADLHNFPHLQKLSFDVGYPEVDMPASLQVSSTGHSRPLLPRLQHLVAAGSNQGILAFFSVVNLPSTTTVKVLPMSTPHHQQWTDLLSCALAASMHLGVFTTLTSFDIMLSDSTHVSFFQCAGRHTRVQGPSNAGAATDESYTISGHYLISMNDIPSFFRGIGELLESAPVESLHLGIKKCLPPDPWRSLLRGLPSLRHLVLPSESCPQHSVEDPDDVSSLSVMDIIEVLEEKRDGDPLCRNLCTVESTRIVKNQDSSLGLYRFEKRKSVRSESGSSRRFTEVVETQTQITTAEVEWFSKSDLESRAD